MMVDDRISIVIRFFPLLLNIDKLLRIIMIGTRQILKRGGSMQFLIAILYRWLMYITFVVENWNYATMRLTPLSIFLRLEHWIRS